MAVHAVDDVTNRVYEKAVREFLIDVKRTGVAFSTFYERDFALSKYLESLCYLESRGYAAGSNAFHGFAHIFGEHKNRLPLSARALKAWERQQLCREGQPIPYQAMGLIIQTFCEKGLVYEAAAACLQLDCWLREQDWAMLRGRDVTLGHQGKVALLLGDREAGEKVKTGANQGAEVEHVVTKAILSVLVENTEADDLVFATTPERFRREWWKVLKALGLESLGPPHGIRHAGAAHYVANGGDLEVARRRGRWATSGALQRYTKTHVLVRRLATLSDEQVLAGQKFWERPAATMARALRKSPAGGTTIVERLVRRLGGLRGDAVNLGAVASCARPEVGKPRYGIGASLRRK